MGSKAGQRSSVASSSCIGQCGAARSISAPWPQQPHPRHNVSNTWGAPTHQVAGAVGDPGCRARGQQDAASCEAAGRGAPQLPEGGVHHTLAGVGGSEQAQLRPEGEGEEPTPGTKGAAGGPAGRPPESVLADAGERGHVESGHCRRQGPPHSPQLGPRVGRGRKLFPSVRIRGEEPRPGAQHPGVESSSFRLLGWWTASGLTSVGLTGGLPVLAHWPRLGARVS